MDQPRWQIGDDHQIGSELDGLTQNMEDPKRLGGVKPQNRNAILSDRIRENRLGAGSHLLTKIWEEVVWCVRLLIEW